MRVANGTPKPVTKAPQIGTHRRAKKAIHVSWHELWRGPVKLRKKPSERFLANRRMTATRGPDLVQIVLKCLAILRKPLSRRGKYCGAEKEVLLRNRDWLWHFCLSAHFSDNLFFALNGAHRRADFGGHCI
jgi:hypothetical protein